MELDGTPIEISAADFEDTILFIEDIPEFFSPKQLVKFIDWLGNIGALQKLKGILIGKLCGYEPFDEHQKAIMHVIRNKYELSDVPIIANMNFGHTSPMCILPYGTLAEINCDNRMFSILESGVV
jgi:muramoyltetrapeptide carboxypeptidase LdcA involved in peptidoglycan recycling